MAYQTAVDWFQEQIIDIVNGRCKLSEIEIYQKAKEIEKQNMLDFHRWMKENDTSENAEQYANYRDEEMLIEFLNLK